MKTTKVIKEKDLSTLTVLELTMQTSWPQTHRDLSVSVTTWKNQAGTELRRPSCWLAFAVLEGGLQPAGEVLSSKVLRSVNRSCHIANTSGKICV